MIVRDEEKILPRCLKGVQGVADEFIVLDTGSKDNTVAIAKDFGAKVFHFEWRDNFAAARNESLKYATGDWILQIDADEELPNSSEGPLRHAIGNPWRLVYVIKCDDGPRVSQRFGWICRLFRHHPSLRYSRPYHESVWPSVDSVVKQEPGWQTHYEPSIVIRHHGYAPSALAKKYQRGVDIMKGYLKRRPEDSYIWGKLGAAYYGQGNYDEATRCLNKALEINPALPEANYTLGVMLQEQEELESAIPYYKRAIAGDSLLCEARANLGAIYVKTGMLDDAILALKAALATNPELALAHSNLGLAYISKGIFDAGMAALRKAIALDPNLSYPHMNLAVAYTKRGMLDDALLEYERALSIDPDYAKAHYNLAIAYVKRGDHASAIEHCDRALALGAKIHPQLLALLEPYR